MLPKILIIAGGLLIIFGIIGFFSIYLQPIKKSIRVFYKQDVEDYLYEQGNGQKLLQESQKSLEKIFLFIIILGLCSLIPGLVMQYIPRGNDSIFSSKTEGSDVGNDKQSNMSSDNDTDSISADYYIVISGDIVKLNEKTFETIEDFENILSDLDRINLDGSKKTAVIIDDYAISSIYHQVEDIINKCGLKLVPEGDPNEK